MKPEGSSQHPQVPATYPYPEPARSSPYPIPHILLISLAAAVNEPDLFRLLRFEVTTLMPSQNLAQPHKLEDHPLSAVRDCLFNIIAATIRMGGRFSIRNMRTRLARDDRDPLITDEVSHVIK